MESEIRLSNHWNFQTADDNPFDIAGETQGGKFYFFIQN
jgi:hypothetical protein